MLSGTTTVNKNKTLTYNLAEQTPPVLAKNVAQLPTDSWDHDAVQYHQSFANASAYGGTPYAYGVNDLNYYGGFVNGCGGSMWRPYFTSAAWDPYGSGAWAYYPSAGYSWVSPYPWGWTPLPLRQLVLLSGNWMGMAAGWRLDGTSQQYLRGAGWQYPRLCPGPPNASSIGSTVSSSNRELGACQHESHSGLGSWSGSRRVCIPRQLRRDGGSSRKAWAISTASPAKPPGRARCRRPSIPGFQHSAAGGEARMGGGNMSAMSPAYGPQPVRGSQHAKAVLWEAEAVAPTPPCSRRRRPAAEEGDSPQAFVQQRMEPAVASKTAPPSSPTPCGSSAPRPARRIRRPCCGSYPRRRACGGTEADPAAAGSPPSPLDCAHSS